VVFLIYVCDPHPIGPLLPQSLFALLSPPEESGMPRDHVIDPSVIHRRWDADLEPILTIDSGDTVSYDIRASMSLPLEVFQAM
jgi:hypothetical protein